MGSYSKILPNGASVHGNLMCSYKTLKMAVPFPSFGLLKKSSKEMLGRQDGAAM